MKKNSQPTGVSTFAIRTSQRTDQKLQKSHQSQRTADRNIVAN